jgi:hypothetical protein
MTKYAWNELSYSLTHNIAVVVTNQLNTVRNSQTKYHDTPAGGNAMSHAVTYGVCLSTHPGGPIHYTAILHSPFTYVIK